MGGLWRAWDAYSDRPARIDHGSGYRVRLFGGSGGHWGLLGVGEISNSGKNTLIQPTHTLKQWALSPINLVLGGLGSVTAGSGYSRVCLVWRCHLSEARLQLEHRRRPLADAHGWFTRDTDARSALERNDAGRHWSGMIGDCSCIGTGPHRGPGRPSVKLNSEDRHRRREMRVFHG